MLKMFEPGPLNRLPCAKQEGRIMVDDFDSEKSEGYQPTIVHANGTLEYHESGVPITQLGVALGHAEGVFLRASQVLVNRAKKYW